MRKELKWFLFLHLLLLALGIYLTFDLLTLVFDDTLQDAFLKSELNPHMGSAENQEERPDLIPKIIHQTYKTEEVLEHWKAGQRKCIELHPDYKYILWTDEMAREFIEKEYPWLLETFDGYKYPIQRADVIRYTVLSHFGGIYIDLDDACERKLDPLLKVPAFVRRTTPTGVSNDVMGSMPNHPFFEKILLSLQRYDRNWFIPYLTTMFSTGPLFVSVIWEQYKRWGVPKGYEVRVLQLADYKMHDDSFFAIVRGSSWHLDDAKIIKSLGDHIPACIVVGAAIAVIMLFLEYWLLCSICSSRYVPSCSYICSMFLRLIGLGKNENYYVYSHVPASGARQNHGVFPQNIRRLRKDSNLPTAALISDLEKQNPEFTDLSG